MNRRGFSLFELLTALVILAILAAISFKVVNARDQAFLAVIQSDLRNLAVAQEAYWHITEDWPGGARYAPSLQHLDYNTSPDVQMVMAGTARGWTGRATHRRRNDFRCAMYVGDLQALIQPFEPAIEEGLMECEPKSALRGPKK
ncbi:MAG: prepilin-type N-terminal cleavage/methylation domain-containing protein [Gemmatimonadota bacterium]|nr:MAG: prepilin-type N-terminal cleavage/methylation domain-containing protein [Gemmatimonadota bacterium]